ncbi:hypothetical protein CFC21_088660, partial [Triticum aestivum]
IFGKHEAR